MAPPVVDERATSLSTMAALLVEQTVELTHIANTALGEGIGNRAIQVLLAVHSQPGTTPSSLADRMGIARSAVARALRDLEHCDLVVRTSDPTDRRVMRLATTDAGRERIRAFERELVRYFDLKAPGCLERLTPLVKEPPAPARGNVAPLAVTAAMASAGGCYVDDVQAGLARLGVSDDAGRYAISLLREDGQLRPVELALRLRLTTGGVSQLIDRLQAAGMVRRTHLSQGDRRSVLISLTDRGQEASDVILDALDRHLSAICSAYTLATRVDRQAGAA